MTGGQNYLEIKPPKIHLDIQKTEFSSFRRPINSETRVHFIYLPTAVLQASRHQHLQITVSWSSLLFTYLPQHLTSNFLPLPMPVYHELLVHSNLFTGKCRLKILPKSWWERAVIWLVIALTSNCRLMEVFCTLDTRMKLDEILYPLRYFRKCKAPKCFPRGRDLKATRASKNIWAQSCVAWVIQSSGLPQAYTIKKHAEEIWTMLREGKG